MKNIFYLSICFSFVFKLYASRDYLIERKAKRILTENLQKQGVWAVCGVRCIDNILTVTIIHPFIIYDKKCDRIKIKKNNKNKKAILPDKQKPIKTKKYNIFDPARKNFTKKDNKNNKVIKVKNTYNNRSKIKKYDNKRKFNRQYYYDQKLNWLNYFDDDCNDLIFNNNHSKNEIQNDEDEIIEEHILNKYDKMLQKNHRSGSKKNINNYSESYEENYDNQYKIIEEYMLNKYDKRLQKNYRSSSEKSNVLFIKNLSFIK